MLTVTVSGGNIKVLKVH